MITIAATVISLCLSGPASEPVRILEAREALDAATESSDHSRIVDLAAWLSERQPEDAELWYLLGRSAFALDRHELSIEASGRAWALGYRYMPWIALRIARSAAALERDELAYHWLGLALEKGLEDRARLREYPEFERLLDHSRFKALAGVQQPDSRAVGLESDIDFLVAEARRLHPAYAVRAERFEAQAAALKRRASNLGDQEFLFGVMRLLTLLGDGHSWVYRPMEDSPLEVPSQALPVLFYLFEEGLFIVDGTDAGESLVGRQVLRLGRRTPEELLEHSRAVHGAENAMTMRWLGVHFYFRSASFLVDAGAIDDPAKAALTLETPEGSGETISLKTGGFQFPRKLRPPEVQSVATPRYLQRVDENYWFEFLDERTIYFQFNQVRDGESESIADFAERLGAALEKPDVSHLVIDVRHNNGGNNGLLRPLVREIVAFDTRTESTLFVITGRNTFSAAQNFINRIERWTDARFVGEPSSSSPNFIGEETEVILPWSRIRASISSRLWQDSDPGDERSWIAPDIPVPPRADDYFSGRDRALEAIIQLIRAGEGK